MLKLKMEESLAFFLNLMLLSQKQSCRQMQGKKIAGRPLSFRRKKSHSDLLKGSHRRIKDVISVLNTDGIFPSQVSLRNLRISLEGAPLGHVEMTAIKLPLCWAGVYDILLSVPSGATEHGRFSLLWFFLSLGVSDLFSVECVWPQVSLCPGFSGCSLKKRNGIPRNRKRERRQAS